MQKITVKQLIVVAMMSAVFGVLFMFLDGLYQPISALLGPIFSALTFGIYAMSAFLPSYVVRKAGAGLIGSVFASIVNILAGSPYGIHIIVAGALQGLGVEVGYGIFKYKKYGIINFLISAIFVTVFVTLRDYFVFGMNQMPIPMLMATIVIRIVSAAIIPFILCKFIAIGLEKANLMPKHD